MAVEVVPAVGRFEDLARVLGPSSPGAGACWCMSYRDSRVSNSERPGYMRQECGTAPGPGVLVYVDGEVAGWCSVAPRSSHRRLMGSRTIPTLDDRDPWSVVCFVIRPPYRRQGLMHVLLAGAVEHAADHGAQVIEGYPVETGGTRVDATAGYVGTVELFEAAGFHRASPTTAHAGRRERWLMRRELSGDPPRRASSIIPT
jgi:GNAT superfamily N-acetyltransferase